jgi:hypothetical protein
MAAELLMLRVVVARVLDARITATSMVDKSGVRNLASYFDQRVMLSVICLGFETVGSIQPNLIGETAPAIAIAPN